VFYVMHMPARGRQTEDTSATETGNLWPANVHHLVVDSQAGRALIRSCKLVLTESSRWVRIVMGVTVMLLHLVLQTGHRQEIHRQSWRSPKPGLRIAPRSFQS